MDWKSTHKKHLTEFPHVLAGDFLENCNLPECSVVFSAYGESLFTVTEINIVALKNYPTVSNNNIKIKNNNYIIYYSYLKNLINLDENDFSSGEVCKYKKSSLVNLKNA